MQWGDKRLQLTKTSLKRIQKKPKRYWMDWIDITGDGFKWEYRFHVRFQYNTYATGLIWSTFLTLTPGMPIIPLWRDTASSWSIMNSESLFQKLGRSMVSSNIFFILQVVRNVNRNKTQRKHLCILRLRVNVFNILQLVLSDCILIIQEPNWWQTLVAFWNPVEINVYTSKTLYWFSRRRALPG